MLSSIIHTGEMRTQPKATGREFRAAWPKVNSLIFRETGNQEGFEKCPFMTHSCDMLGWFGGNWMQPPVFHGAEAAAKTAVQSRPRYQNRPRGTF